MLLLQLISLDDLKLKEPARKDAEQGCEEDPHSEDPALEKPDEKFFYDLKKFSKQRFVPVFVLWYPAACWPSGRSCR